MECECVQNLLKKITKLRKKEITIDEDDFSVVSPSSKHVWTKMFAEHFLVAAHCTVAHCSAHSDDMLWYVRHTAPFYLGSNTPPIEVFRRQSKKQPLPGDSSVNWEETVYLNLILQQIEYQVTCAVCTKTSPQNLQILRKTAQRVYPSPSRRRMDHKGESEELAYPNIYFAIDDFEQVFGDVVARDGECVCVELVARDRSRRRESAVFLGSIRYEVLKQVYDSRASATWQWAQKLVAGGQRRQEFVRMRGPHGRGHAEMAVARVAGSGLETPLADGPAFDAFQVEAVSRDVLPRHAPPSQAEQYTRRRMSDTNLNKHMYYKRGSDGPKKAYSEADCANQYPEVDANSIDDELDEGVFSRLWTVRGFGQAWHWLREKRRAASTPLNAYLTYVTLPWNMILDDLIERKRKPVLTFDAEEDPE